MIDNNDSSDDEQNYQLSRRNLLRAGGAAAGVGAAGGIPAATGIEHPVEPAEGVAVSATALAIGAGAIGLGVGVGGALAFDELFGQSADSVKTQVTKSSIYDAIEDTMISQSAAVADLGDELGVDNSTRPTTRGDNLVSPDDNPHVHTMVEESYAAAAEEWADGGTLSEAQSAARTAAKVVSTTSEWTIVANWSAAVNSASEAFLQHYARFGTSNEVLSVPDIDGDLEATPQRFTAAAAPNPKYSAVGTVDDEGDKGVLLVRDISQELPVDPSDLPSDEVPDNGFKVTEICVEGDLGNLYVLGPYPDEHPRVSGRYLGAEIIQASHSGNVAQLELWRYRELLHATDQILQTVLSNLDDNVETMYLKLNSGEITLNDILSARQLYQSYESPSDLERSAAELMAAGVYEVSSSTVTLSFGGSTYSGTLFVSLPSDITVSGGETITSSEHQGGYILSQSEGQVRVPETVDLSIESVSDPDGDGETTWENRESYGPDGSNLNDIEQRLDENQQRYEELQNQIEELDNDGPLGGGGGIDGILGDNGILIVGGAAVAAYLLGR